MKAAAAYLAVDLGAESGRVFAAAFDGEEVELDEVHRFENVPVRLPDGLYWDVLSLFHGLQEGLSKAAGRAPAAESVGVDAWAVDFGLLDRDGALLSNPRHYRDGRTEGMLERAFGRVAKEEIYSSTGIQFMRINTLYQLLAMEDSPLLEVAQTLLMIPDLFSFWLTGRGAGEYTAATSTQLYRADGAGWDLRLMENLGVPARIFPDVVNPGTEIGPLLPAVAEETGLAGDTPVVAVASHDTASAVVAVPATGEDFAYVSSGTWSLVGVETREPVISYEGLRHNFTNEGGFAGTNRLLKNVMGLWLLQECRREWARRGKSYSYEDLVRLAEEAPAFGPVVDPDDPSLLAPGDVPARVARLCGRTGQKAPGDEGEMVRCIFESLALKYRWVTERAAEISGKDVRVLHVVGGGSRNDLLNQLTADAAAMPVLAGPVEATALGNAMVQAHARGRVGSLAEIREVVRRSVEPRRYEPSGDAEAWADARERFERVVGQPETKQGGG